jgi:hypothetical protein
MITHQYALLLHEKISKLEPINTLNHKTKRKISCREIAIESQGKNQLCKGASSYTKASHAILGYKSQPIMAYSL